MKIVRFTSDESFVNERFNISRFDQDDIVRILDFAFDEQKGFLCDHEAKLFEQVRIDNRI